MKKLGGYVLGVVLLVTPITASAQVYTDEQKQALIAVLQQLVVILTQQLQQLLDQQKQVLGQQQQLLDKFPSTPAPIPIPAPNPLPVSQEAPKLIPTETVYDISVNPTVSVTNNDITLPYSKDGPKKDVVLGTLYIKTPDYPAKLLGLTLTMVPKNSLTGLISAQSGMAGTGLWDGTNGVNFWVNSNNTGIDFLLPAHNEYPIGEYSITIDSFRALLLGSSTSSENRLFPVAQQITFRVQ